MGTLQKFDIKTLVDKYQLQYFIETGTWTGEGVWFAAQFDFLELHSIELMKSYYDACCAKFQPYPKIKIYHGMSVTMLTEILTKQEIGRTLFWLDAHLPNFYDKNFDTNYNENPTLLIPLEEELKIIVNNKSVANDVFIIDDLRIYETGDFQSGNWLDVINSGHNTGIDFIVNLLGETHTIQKFYEHEGYIVCLPKENNPEVTETINE